MARSHGTGTLLFNNAIRRSLSTIQTALSEVTQLEKTEKLSPAQKLGKNKAFVALCDLARACAAQRTAHSART